MRTMGIFDRFEDSEAFFTADREVGSLYGGASLAATQMSAGTLVGAVGLHYLFGLGFLWTWIGIWAGWLLSLVAIAPRLRDHGGYTVPDFLGERFGGDRGYVRGISAGLIAVIYLVYTTAQYVAGSVVLEALLGTPQWVGAAIVAVLALSYTLVGGMRVSVYTDAVQVSVLVGALLLASVAGVVAVGGPGRTIAAVATVDASLLNAIDVPTVAVGIALSFGFGITIAPYELSRVYAMRDPGTVKRAIPVSIAIQAVVAACIALLGLVARVRFPGLGSPDAAVTVLAADLFGSAVGAVLLLGVLAAILSTVDSVLLVTASAVAHDLYAETVPALSGRAAPADGRVLRIAQATTVAAALLPLAFVAVSGLLGGLVQFIVALYTSLLASTLFVPVVAGLHWKGATTAGALGGMVAGLAAVVVWQLTTAAEGSLAAFGAVDPVVPGLLCSVGATVALSVLTGR